MVQRPAVDHLFAALRDAGTRLLTLYSPDDRPSDWNESAHAGHRNEEASLRGLRATLTAIRPQAQWVDDNQETAELPPGEWWVVDVMAGRERGTLLSAGPAISRQRHR